MSIDLSKGQKIELKKSDGTSLSKVMMGLGWDAVDNRGFFNIGGSANSIDLDASCVLYDEHKQLIDAVSFRQLRSRDGSIQHSGDNLTGHGDGDDETISVNLSSVPPNVKSIVFTINSFRGQTFDQVKNCFARLVDMDNNKEICIYKLAENGNHTAKIMAKVYRHNGEWKFAAIGAPANGATISEIARDITAHL